MTRILIVARAETRRRWVALLGLALLIGVSGAVMLAGIGGARRAASSVDRFLATSRIAEIRIDPDIGQNAALGTLPIEEVARLPGVDEVVPFHALLVSFEAGPFGIAASPDPRFPTELNRPRLLEGRFATAADEIAVNETAAVDYLDAQVGDRVQARTMTPAELEALLAGGEAAMTGPELDLEVVGIFRLPEDLPTTLDVFPNAFASAAFYETYVGEVGGFDAAGVFSSAADVGAVAAEIQELLGGAYEVVDQHAEATAMTEDGVRVVVVALALFGGVALLAAAVFVGQALTRHLAQLATVNPTLHALGYTRRERALAGALAVLPAVVLGAVLAGAGALVLSPYALFGLPRRADPDPGIAADWTVVGLGAGLIAVFALAWALYAGWRMAAGVRHRRPARRSRLAAAFSRAGLTPSASLGARLAFEPGAGAFAVPVRSAVTGTVLGFAGVVASLAFAASAAHMVDTPATWGFAWDLGPVYGNFESFSELDVAAISSTPGVAAVGLASDAYLELDGQELVGFSIEAVVGEVDVEMLDGRPPATSGEVALGTETMESLGIDIGDSVEVAPTAGGDTATVRVVGRAVLPETNMTGPSSGVLFTPDGLDTHAELFSTGVVVRYAPGADRAAVEEAIAAAGGALDVQVYPETAPAEIANVDETVGVPRALAGFFAILGTAGLTHAVVTAGRRRRHDLAVVEALGFVGAQVRAAIRWQAVLTIVTGAALGVPIGLLVGRSVWGRVAYGLGVADDLTVPLVELSLALLASLVAALLIAAVPGWAATRRRPATVLRTE